VCLAFSAALERFGAPEEVLTDNGKQFTARFGRSGGEALFDKICRRNGIAHLLTKPKSPTTTGKIERFHLTRDLTTQEAADLLRVSRPHLIKLLDAGEIAHHRVGCHRRLRTEDVLAYRERRDAERSERLRELAQLSEEVKGGYR
jgi:excisionase family DNA binding protein